jgi:hypothetical protein
MSERTEALMRIPIAIVSGIIISVWKMLIVVFTIFNFVAVIFTGKRVKDLAELSEMWNTQQYVFVRYLSFVSNKRPFPFEKLSPNMSRFELK